MQAYQIKSGSDIKPLPFQSAYRKGDAPAEVFRKQATGELQRVVPDLKPGRFVRTITLRNGAFTGLASDGGSLLSFVISGELTLTPSGGASTRLVPGDMLLLDEAAVSRLDVSANDNCRLVQVGVSEDWPGPEAKIQDPGTPTARDGGKITVKRVYKGADDLAYYRDFPELFSAPLNEWSQPRALVGFRLMCWEDGFIDWHPEVVNNFAIFLSGELELIASGDGVSNVFHAGDICLAEDRTGKGHIDVCRGITHTALLVMDDKDLW
jgi:hypothetical protein